MARGDNYGGGGWGRYVPVAERRAKAARELAKRAKRGLAVTPVVIEGRTIARTFWGEAWCENLEAYSDLANRLPRGRTYVRNGSVVHLEVSPGEVRALVSGSELYAVLVRVRAVSQAHWRAIVEDCAGSVASVVELLQGRLSRGVMERICRPKTGLFPAPAEIELGCTCPDGAVMCKHVAAVLYGIGARLDSKPELLFRLRQVDEAELVASAGAGLTLDDTLATSGRALGGADLSALFGVELAASLKPPVESPTTTKRRADPATPPGQRVRLQKSISGKGSTTAEASAKAEPAKTAKTSAKAKPAKTAKTSAKAKPAEAGEAAGRLRLLAKGAGVQMLAGTHAGRTGAITWVKDKGDRATYAVTFEAASGKATTQVSSTSYGTKWKLVGPGRARGTK